MALQRVLSDPKPASSGVNVSLLHVTEQQKQAFELELRMYEGNDPLDVWDRYIKWIEQSYGKTDKGSSLCGVLERAVQQFVDDKKFYDDPRYVDMWIKLARNSTQPLNMFSYMQTEGIGVQQAALYVAWSDSLEMQGDLQQADIIFLEGLKCGARPLDELQRHYRAFQSRLSGQAVEHGADLTQERQDIEPQLPSSVGRRTRRNRRVLASVNGEEDSVAGKSNFYQPSTSGMEQSRSMCVFDESQAGSGEHAVIGAKENQFVTQRTDDRVCSSGDVNPPSGPGTTQSQNLVEPPHGSDDAPLAAENGLLSNQSEDQPGFQSMYCKELLFKGPSEFCFEELRAERYFASMQQKLKEKQVHLNKEKERLRQLIEQKLQAKSTSSQDNGPPSRNTEIYPDNLPSEEGSVQNVQPRPFTVFSENAANALPRETAPVVARSKSLKLPAPILKTRGSPSYPFTEKDCTDRSLSQAEEAIVNSHRNKTLSISPDDTYDFARAAMLASTPFGGVRGQSGSAGGNGAVTEVLRGVPAESCPNTTPQTPAEPTQTNKLSPILEVSQEWRSMSTAAQRTHHTAGPASSTSVTLPPVLDEAEEDLEQEMEMADAHEDQAIDPCSLEVRKYLLQKINLQTLPDLHPQTSPLPSSVQGLRLGGQMLSYLLKMPDLENHYLLASEEADEDSVVLKVDRSPVPWDFYICSQLKARLPAGTEGHFLNQSSSFLFEDGCVTLWRVPRETTLAELMADKVNDHLVAHLALRLVEMVIRMHICHLVHGALRPHTLIYYPSPTPSDRQHGVVMAIDFSCSLDLQLQADVQTVGSLGNAADYVSQGLLSTASSPYKLDLLGVAETVHQMLFKRGLDVVKAEAGWSLAESAETSEGSLHSVWHKFFQKILNSGEKSTVTLLTELQEDLRDYTENVVGTLII